MTIEQYNAAVHSKIKSEISSKATYDAICAALPKGIPAELMDFTAKCLSIGADIGAQAATDVIKASGTCSIFN